MTQEEKSLLLKDLCARLPYNVKIEITILETNKVIVDQFDYMWLGILYSENTHHIIKPYLRPMSSMTEEEKEELYHYYCKEIADNLNTPNLTWEIRCCVSNSFGTDWLNKKMFDYRGLIPMGLAIEAPKGMYEY